MTYVVNGDKFITYLRKLKRLKNYIDKKGLKIIYCFMKLIHRIIVFIKKKI